MRYGFILLKDKVTNNEKFIEISTYYKIYSNLVDSNRYQIVSLVIYDNIYVACFPLLFDQKEIEFYNESCCIFDVITPRKLNKLLTPSNVYDICCNLKCDNLGMSV